MQAVGSGFSAKCSVTLYRVAAAPRAGSAPGMGTEEPGLWHSTGKRREGAFSLLKLPALAATMACGASITCDSQKRLHQGYSVGRDRVGGWLTVGFSAQPTPSARCHSAGRASEHTQAPWLTAPVKGIVLEQGGHESSVTGGHKAHCTFQGPWVTLFFDLGRCPQEGSSGCRAFAYVTHMWCCLSWTDSIDTIYKRRCAPDSRRDTVSIFFPGNFLNNCWA